MSDLSWNYDNLKKWIADKTTKSPNVKTLNLNNNKLTVLPQDITELINLAVLNLSWNELTMLPPKIKNLIMLRYLILANNQFTVYPHEIKKLHFLQKLDLSKNQLTMLPPEIGDLERLQVLDFSLNYLTEVPDEIGNLERLTRLYLTYNFLTEFPQGITKLINLEHLSLTGNFVTEIPHEIKKLQNLEHLGLSENLLTMLPPEIGDLKNLEVLDLADNQLTALPQEITKLINLEELNLANNQLTALPQEIINLINLKELDLTGNPLLTTIPPELEQMPNLKILRDEPKKTQDLHPLYQPTLNIFKNVLCNNYLEGEDNTIPDFLTETLDENPFIVEHKNIYSGNALGWLLKEFPDEKDPREFVECKDETPSEWQGNAYAKYIKPGGRTFVNIRVNGSNILVLKPDWFWYGPIPETRVFHLEPQAPVKKYMTNHLLPNMRPDFNALGADHCNQTGEIIPYKLLELIGKSAPAFATVAKFKTNSSASAVGGKRLKIYKTLKRKQTKRKHKKTKRKKTKRKKTKHKKTKHKKTKRK